MNYEITLENIDKTFYKNGPNRVLKNINLNIKPQDIATLYGPSGSGKSTILNIVSGLDYPTSGRVILHGEDITKLSPADLTLYRRKNIGFVFQSYNLFPALTTLENISIISELNGISPTLIKEDAKAALISVGLGQMEKKYPDELSGGQQQRVAIARAIVSKPKILFADEPTANLDSQTAKTIIDLLFNLNKTIGTTILFSTHDKNIVDRVNTIIQVKDGEIIS